MTNTETCQATHNPGDWPYIARCAFDAGHNGPHRDMHGREWVEEPHDDPSKLRMVADWFDRFDEIMRPMFEQRGVVGGDEVQVDLRRIADGLEKVVSLLRDMDRQQTETDEEGGREVAWYYSRNDVEDALGLERGTLRADTEEDT